MAMHDPDPTPDSRPRQRADIALVDAGVFATRARARAAIEAGLVKADGRSVRKPSERVAAGARFEASEAHPWASRAGLKLAEALKVFGLDPKGLLCLDLGASTGGFTDVLLAGGAAHVCAVDVGRGQLLERLREHPRVTSLEGLDARALTPLHLERGPPALIVADLSFIGLAKAIQPALAAAAPACDLVALVKPQFEAGPQRVGKGGIVAPETAAEVAREVRAALNDISGFSVGAMIESPIKGGDGNTEYLLHARRA